MSLKENIKLSTNKSSNVKDIKQSLNTKNISKVKNIKDKVKPKTNKIYILKLSKKNQSMVSPKENKNPEIRISLNNKNNKNNNKKKISITNILKLKQKISYRNNGNLNYKNQNQTTNGLNKINLLNNSFIKVNGTIKKDLNKKINKKKLNPKSIINYSQKNIYINSNSTPRINSNTSLKKKNKNYHNSISLVKKNLLINNYNSNKCSKNKENINNNYNITKTNDYFKTKENEEKKEILKSRRNYSFNNPFFKFNSLTNIKENKNLKIENYRYKNQSNNSIRKSPNIYNISESPLKSNNKNSKNNFSKNENISLNSCQSFTEQRNSNIFNTEKNNFENDSNINNSLEIIKESNKIMENTLKKTSSTKIVEKNLIYQKFNGNGEKKDINNKEIETHKEKRKLRNNISCINNSRNIKKSALKLVKKELKTENNININNKNISILSKSVVNLNNQNIFNGKIEDYNISKELGKGSYAVVKLATHKITKKKYAIKIYTKKSLSNKQKKNTVTNEIKILNQLDHINIMKLYEIIETSENLYLVLEYIKGNSLLEIIKKENNNIIEEKRALKLFLQIVQGISYLHSNNISHRDIKLENILVTKNDTVKIIDFGFAVKSDKNTFSKFFCGTPSYMSPEIVSKKKYVAQYSEIWSLGVLLFAMLYGRFPFKGKNEEDLFMKIKEADLYFPDEKVFISSKVKKLFEKIFVIEPTKRPTPEEIENYLKIYI